jgi:hypothetical protein
VQAGISKLEIDRLPNQLKIRIHTSKPGLVIGKKGAGVDQLKRRLEAQVGREVVINIEEVVRPELEIERSGNRKSRMVFVRPASPYDLKSRHRLWFLRGKNLLWSGWREGLDF